MRPGRPIVAAMFVVVLSFAGALVYLQLHLRPLTQGALTVVDHAAPSIEHLSEAQTELTRLGLGVSEYVTQDRDSRTVSRGDVVAARRQLSAKLEAFRRLSDFPAEDELLAQIDGDLGRLDRATARALDEADARHASVARQALHGGFQPELLQTSTDFASLKALNARYASTAADAVLRTRREAILVAVGFGGLGVLVAVLATVLVIRLLGFRARLINQHTQMLGARASELEAFAGRVAHDLRNPLSAVALRVLAASRRAGLDPRLHEDLDKVARQVQRMNDIIDGLLEFARAGATPARDASADLGDVLEEAVADLRPAAASAGASIVVEAFPPTRVACTPGALTSVLSNLVGNAVKYIGDGRDPARRIVVRVRDGRGAVRIEVDDNGPGLPPGSEERVFEPFLRVNPSNKPGIGLGLATVKKIVEAYRGRTGVDSRLGRGSTFWFELPRATGAEPLPPGGPTPRRDQDLAPS
ncbi:MAG: HAMP domain-containing sensor histidine kinase [Pseudomonadota bacterium]